MQPFPKLAHVCGAAGCNIASIGLYRLGYLLAEPVPLSAVHGR